MKHRWLVGVVTLGIASCFNATAAGAANRNVHRSNIEQTMFRLHADTSPGPHTTFWIAYGPLDGRFGLAQLRSVGRGDYVAEVQLPSSGRTTFAFLAGSGVMHARFGAAPGNPVQTVSKFGPMAVANAHLLTAEWQAPLG